MAAYVRATPLGATALLVLLAACRPSSGRLLAAAPIGAAPPPVADRLERTVRPTRYRATLAVFRSSYVFSGNVDIDLVTDHAIGTVWLHAVGLTIERSWLEVGGATWPIHRVHRDKQRLGFELPRTLPSGAARLHVEYRGELGANPGYGLFRQRLGESEYVFSQFEPTYARRAFPCFDEPALKAPWQLTLVIKREDVAVSNTPIERDTGDRGAFPYRTVTFAETPPMSSYALAFAVGPFAMRDLGTHGRARTPMRLYFAAGREPASRTLPDIPALFESVEALIGLPYPFGKLDLVAMPEQTWFSAQENLGMITVRDADLFEDPSAANTLRHEIAHQWFGNLITARWWNDIWINEGLTTWIERHLASDDIVRGDSAFMLGQALSHDAMGRAPRSRSPSLKEEPSAYFDATAIYLKPAAVLSMLDAWAGQPIVLPVLRGLLAAHRLGNLDANDVFEAFARASHPRAAEVLRSFLGQRGVPLVSGRLVCPRQGAYLALEQRALRPARDWLAPEEAAKPWAVPVCVAYASSTGRRRACTLLTDRTAELQLPGDACPDWALLNSDGTGYHVSLHDPELLARLVRHKSALVDAELAAVARDLAMLVRVDQMPIDDGLRRLAELAPATEAAGWLAWVLEDPAIRHAALDVDRTRFGRFVRASLGTVARSAVLRSTRHEAWRSAMARNALEVVAREAGAPERVDEARALVTELASSRDPSRSMELLLAGEVLAWENEPTALATVRAAALNAPGRVRPMLLRVLGCSRDAAARLELLELLLHPALALADRRAIVDVMGWDEGAQSALLDFVRTHPQLRKVLDPDWVLDLSWSICDGEIAAVLRRLAEQDLVSWIAPPQQAAFLRRTETALRRVRACTEVRAVAATAWRHVLSAADPPR